MREDEEGAGERSGEHLRGEKVGNFVGFKGLREEVEGLGEGKERDLEEMKEGGFLIESLGVAAAAVMWVRVAMGCGCGGGGGFGVIEECWRMAIW